MEGARIQNDIGNLQIRTQKLRDKVLRSELAGYIIEYEGSVYDLYKYFVSKITEDTLSQFSNIFVSLAKKDNTFRNELQKVVTTFTTPEGVNYIYNLSNLIVLNFEKKSKYLKNQAPSATRNILDNVLKQIDKTTETYSERLKELKNEFAHKVCYRYKDIENQAEFSKIIHAYNKCAADYFNPIKEFCALKDLPYYKNNKDFITLFIPPVFAAYILQASKIPLLTPLFNKLQFITDAIGNENQLLTFQRIHYSVCVLNHFADEYGSALCKLSPLEHEYADADLIKDAVKRYKKLDVYSVIFSALNAKFGDEAFNVENLENLKNAKNQCLNEVTDLLDKFSQAQSIYGTIQNGNNIVFSQVIKTLEDFKKYLTATSGNCPDIPIPLYMKI